MKQFYTLLTMLILSISSFAQYSTQGFSFQGYASDPEGKALGSVGITVKFTLYSGSNTAVTYAEEQNVTTDAYGVFSATVGKGTVVGVDTKTPFAALNMNLYKYSLKVEVKKTAGGSYTSINDAELNAVPYARSAENGVPVGTMVAFGGPIANIPTGWAYCDGAEKDGTLEEWKALFNAIGLSWGGSGSSFRLPDARGMFLRGVDGGRGLDNNASTRTAQTTGGNEGDKVGSVQSDDFKSHNHTASQVAHTHTYGDAFWSEAQSANGGSPIRYEYNPTDTDNTGGGQGSAGGDGDNYLWVMDRTSNSSTPAITVNNNGGLETRPENVAVYYIIKK